MAPRRFIPRLDLLEDRETPATGLTPDQVLSAAALADFFAAGTRAALDDPAFIRQAGNRAGVQALAGAIVAQSAALDDVLARYVVGLREEQAAAAPVYAGFFGSLIGRFAGAANAARLAGVQAQQVAGLVDQFTAAAARAAVAGQTGTTGIGTTDTGTGTTGIGTGTANALPTNDDLNGTTTGTPTTPGSTGTGTTGGTTFGDGTGTGTSGTGTTGGGTTSVTPTPTGTVSTGAP